MYLETHIYTYIHTVGTVYNHCRLLFAGVAVIVLPIFLCILVLLIVVAVIWYCQQSK